MFDKIRLGPSVTADAVQDKFPIIGPDGSRMR